MGSDVSVALDQTCCSPAGRIERGFHHTVSSKVLATRSDVCPDPNKETPDLGNSVERVASMLGWCEAIDRKTEVH